MRPLLLALGVVLLAPRVASAQDFVPFDTPAPPPAEAAATPPAPAPAKGEEKGEEKKKDGEQDEEEFIIPKASELGLGTPASAPAPAPTTPAPAATTAPAGSAPAADPAPGADPGFEAPDLGTPAPGGETATFTGDAAADASAEDDGGRRVISEELIDESVEPTGASALAPATRKNGAAAMGNERPSPTFSGAIGLATQRTARVGPEGSVRIALTGEFFLLDDFLIVGDRESRQAATFAVGFTPVEWLEVYANIAYASATNTLSAPTLLQIQGDSSVGVKGAYVMDNGVALGLDLELSFFPPIGEVGVGAAGFTPRALFAYDFRPAVEKLPLIFHLEVGANIDGTGNLPGTIQLTRVEEFALGIHRYNRFRVGAGLEAPLPWVSPFVAWRMWAPLGEVELPEVNDDGSIRTLTYGEVISQHLTLGLRVTALRDLSFLAAVDLGLNGAAIPGVPATMPWNLMLGLSYTFDPLSRSERVTRTMEKTVEVDKPIETRPPAGLVEGIVRDAATNEPLPGVLITVDESGTLPVASAVATGQYRSRDIPPGQIQLTAVKEGYAPVSAAALVADKAITPLDFALQKLVISGSVTLAVTDTKNKAGLPAKITVIGPEAKEIVAGADGKALLELKPGTYRMDITAEGHNARQRDLEVENGSKILLDLELSPKAKTSLIVVRKKKIQLKRKVHFQLGKANILPDSYQLLDQVIDAVVSHKIEKLRIEGHTDSTGADSRNLRLSQARAESVRGYFLENGIGEDRIQAKGFGETRPIAPNLTKRGRAMNRRVEFIIVAK